MTRQKQKQEALKRMKLLKLHSNVINEFKKEDVVYYSERQNAIFDGILYWVSNKPEYVEIIKEFETRHNALVYHAQFTRTTFGDCLTLLYVSQYDEEWEMDEHDLSQTEIMHTCAYVVNLDDHDCSEFGYVGLVRKNGGVSRVY